jgi:hypothetical protein
LGNDSVQLSFLSGEAEIGKNWFTKGFDMADLQEAKSLLGDLVACQIISW